MSSTFLNLLLHLNSSLTLYAEVIPLPPQIHSSHFPQQVQSNNIHLLSSFLSSKFLQLMQRKASIQSLLTNPHHLCAQFIHPTSTTFLFNLLRPIGVILTCILSWSPHIQAFCSKAKKVIAYIYNTFYKHC